MVQFSAGRSAAPGQSGRLVNANYSSPSVTIQIHHITGFTVLLFHCLLTQGAGTHAGDGFQAFGLGLEGFIGVDEFGKGRVADGVGSRDRSVFAYDETWLGATDRFALEPGLPLVAGPTESKRPLV